MEVFHTLSRSRLAQPIARFKQKDSNHHRLCRCPCAIDPHCRPCTVDPLARYTIDRSIPAPSTLQLATPSTIWLTVPPSLSLPPCFSATPSSLDERRTGAVGHAPSYGTAPPTFPAPRWSSTTRLPTPLLTEHRLPSWVPSGQAPPAFTPPPLGWPSAAPVLSIMHSPAAPRHPPSRH
jgi:hypothetical protein